MTTKRWLFVLLTLAALLILPSCGKGGKSNPTSSGQPPTVKSQEVQTPTSAPEIERFLQEGEGANGLSVIVTLPWQGQPMKIEQLPFDPPSNAKDEPPFHLIRPFINFEVLDADGKIVPSFNKDSPLVIEAQYSADDLAKAEGNKLILGFEKNGVWTQLGDTAINDSAMTGTVSVTEWGDRHIGWGW
jgi:hypothetical protein